MTTDELYNILNKLKNDAAKKIDRYSYFRCIIVELNLVGQIDEIGNPKSIRFKFRFIFSNGIICDASGEYLLYSGGVDFYFNKIKDSNN